MEAIGTLAGGIAHDFNNILTAILAFTELSLAQITADHPSYRNLVEVMKGGQRGKHLVEQILTFSHQTSEERKPVRLHLIVDEVLQLIRAKAFSLKQEQLWPTRHKLIRCCLTYVPMLNMRCATMGGSWKLD